MNTGAANGGIVLKNSIPGFLDQDDLSEIWQTMENKPRWKYTCFAGGQRFWYYQVFLGTHWHHDGYHLHWIPDVEHIWTDVFERIMALTAPGFSPWRFIINGQTMGQEGGIHSDFGQGRESDSFVCYLNPEWRPEWLGSTQFFDQEDRECLSVLPEPGKLIHYDGKIKHRGQAPSVPNLLRVTLSLQGRYG